MVDWGQANKSLIGQQSVGNNCGISIDGTAYLCPKNWYCYGSTPGNLSSYCKEIPPSPLTSHYSKFTTPTHYIRGRRELSDENKKVLGIDRSNSFRFRYCSDYNDSNCYIDTKINKSPQYTQSIVVYKKHMDQHTFSV